MILAGEEEKATFGQIRLFKRFIRVSESISPSVTIALLAANEQSRESSEHVDLLRFKLLNEEEKTKLSQLND